MAQWLRFPPSNAGGPGLISGQGARCHMPLNYDLAQPNKFLKMKQKRPGKFLPVEVMYETSGKAFGPGSSLLFLLSLAGSSLDLVMIITCWGTKGPPYRKFWGPWIDHIERKLRADLG